MTDPIRPTIRGQQVYLRPPERDDVPLFVDWFSDADVLRHLMMRVPMSVAMEEAWFERMLAAEGKTDYHFVVCLLADVRPIGTVGLQGIDVMSQLRDEWLALPRKKSWELEA